MKNIKKEKQKYSLFIHKKLFFILDIMILLSYGSMSKMNLRNLNDYNFSEVHLVIIGNGTQNLLSEEFIYEPSEVLVNGVSKGAICNKTCELDDEESNITLRFEQKIEFCDNMFKNLENIKMIDLSEFDFSKVRNMSSMFCNCTNLKEIIFGNINTSLVEDMKYLFFFCSSLDSIDLSSFDTSLVTNMGYMFTNCFSLSSINLSTFNTSNVEYMRSMFGSCIALYSIDISNFDFSKVTSMNLMFFNDTNLRKVNFGDSKTSSLQEMRSLFYECKNLISVDLSNFNTTLVTDMRWVFYNCISIKYIYFSESFDTSNVLTTFSMFYNCRNLISLNLSSFDISKVTEMAHMFYNCNKLKYLDLSTFISLSLNSIVNLFKNCNSLIYLNLYSFKINSTTTISSSLDSINSDTKFCLNDPFTEEKLLFPKNFTSNCSDICFEQNIKLDIVTNECIKSCSDHNYGYECNNICYNKCPEDTYPTLNTPNICYNRRPEGYFLDSYDSIYKPCYWACDYCFGKGNETIHNCKKCKSGFVFLNDNIYNNNCYKPCNYYYYFNESNSYTCTEDYICPEKYKLIIEKYKCIDECKNDDLYQYEFNNYCYKECPEGTILKETNHTCYLNPISENSLLNATSLTNNIETEKSEFISQEKILSTNSKSSYINESIESITFQNIMNDKTINIINITIIHNIDDILTYLQQMLIAGFNMDDINNGIDFIHSEEKVTFTITTSTNQKERKNKYNNVTTIDLGKCENILREAYNISTKEDLYILKIDNYLEGLNIPKVEYEIYYPFIENKLQKANLSLCSNTKIDISIPINLSISELDKHNASSNLYNDICYTLTTDSGTDISLKDRRDEFINNNLSVCEEDCLFTEYDNINKKAICSCFAKIKLPLISEIKVDKNKFLNNFIDIHNIANIKVLKCIKLMFKKENFFKNSAHYLIVILFSLGTISAFMYFFREKEKINGYLNKFANENKLNKGNDLTIITSTKNIKKNKNKEKNKILYEINKKSKYYEPPKKKGKNKRKRVKIIKTKQMTSQSDINIINNKKSSFNETKNRNNVIIKNRKITEPLNISKNNENVKSEFSLKPKSEKEINETYTDIEMNSLNYEEAIKCDYRTYFQYFLSLLKTRHILFFSFFKVQDYNSQMIKIYIFFFTFAINYTVSAMFYSDSTMHKIYEDEGSFDFTYQLPQMLYSLIISSLLKILLTTLGLYGRNLIEIKNLKNKSKNESIIKVSMVISLKMILFFTITYLLLFMFWIYLGCFCVVYKNTQIHLLIEVSSSFGFSFITSFILYLLPGIFRILSLKNRNNDRPCLYKFSKLLQML